MESSSSLTSDSQEHLVFLLRHILMRSLHSGTEHLRSYWELESTQHLWIFGQLAAYLQKWLSHVHCSQVTLRSARYSKYSVYKGHPMRTTGLMLWNSKTSRTPSLNGRAFLCLNMSRKVRWMCTVWTYLRRWCVWSLTPVSLPKQPCNILTSMISIRVVSPSELPNSLFELFVLFNLKVHFFPSRLCPSFAITFNLCDNISRAEFVWIYISFFIRWIDSWI